MESEHERFVREHTAVATPPLCPEIRLHLGAEVTPLWQATEAFHGRQSPPAPFWAFAWPGGQVVARHVLDHPDLVRGLRVLDFASGSGVCAIAACRAGAREVTAAEIDVLAATAMRLNAALNGIQLHLVEADVIGTDDGWDVVLAGDVCYERPLAERAYQWLRSLAQRGALVLLGDPGRAYLPTTGLEELAQYVVPMSKDLEGCDELLTEVWRVLP